MSKKTDALESAVSKRAPGLAGKLSRLVEILSKSSPAVVAFSGGADSALLAYVASAVDPKTLCATAVSETYTPGELASAEEFAREHGLRHERVATRELKDPKFRANPRDRCYHCKKAMLEELSGLAGEHGCKAVLYGESMSDMRDFRPGRKAMKEAGARSPLAEAGLTKEDVRKLSKALGLKTWDRPSNACLASRIEYGMELTPELLARIGEAESMLHMEGCAQVRVRVHGSLARIELGAGCKLSHRKLAAIAKRIKKLGFAHVTLDLEGYRSGSMNEA
ncbi:MAG: ATP-dependent sacrificial sulfur transferase LarE [Methanobacteriota archaeon]